MEPTPDSGHRVVGVCKKGCGLLLQGEDLGEGGHCCVDALRALADALEEKSATLEHEVRMEKLRWSRREQSLLARVSTVQQCAQLAAVKYERRLHQYKLHVNSLAEQLIGSSQVRSVV